MSGDSEAARAVRAFRIGRAKRIKRQADHDKAMLSLARLGERMLEFSRVANLEGDRPKGGPMTRLKIRRPRDFRKKAKDKAKEVGRRRATNWLLGLVCRVFGHVHPDWVVVGRRRCIRCNARL